MCGNGGIGRRAALRMQCHRRGVSSTSSRTIYLGVAQFGRAPGLGPGGKS